ncbi:MAG: ribosome silencing factor [Coriobacteriia bacterium]|nr:ribosome silencing factor [Coriobacteriia bacterium]
MSDAFTSKDLVRAAFEAALEKKATDIMALDMAELLVVTDYFVIATGNTDRQVAAIAEEIEHELREQFGIKPTHREGIREAQWVLLDYGSIVVHLFQPDYRDEYRIEDLWSQAAKLRADAGETHDSDVGTDLSTDSTDSSKTDTVDNAG